MLLPLPSNILIAGELRASDLDRSVMAGPIGKSNGEAADRARDKA
ncbi:hypothetical protein OG936_33665 [Streptomyces sp. NBC_00846]|nr:hypothetical protein OG936_33665 [Streptomyces sp. NBC_00846]